ncbi:MAG: RecX family transcriptional regulator [Oscillospiraceae bacterium]|nr:RecX family transcriptional regulator [Oscillospiraceae bacterium]
MPTITSIEKYKGNTMRVDLDEGEPLFINVDVLNEYHLQKDMTMPDAAIEEIVHSNDFRRAKERALYLLDERDYSFIELYKKLENNYDEDICLEVCNRLSEIGCINDRRYSERLAEHYCVTKRFGLRRAREEMRKRGISNELITEALYPYEDSVQERIAELIDKKYARYLSDEKGVQKVKAALVRQGYSFSEVNKALSDLSEYEDETEEGEE